MKSFEIKALGLEEMKQEELTKTDGGSLLVAAAIAIAALLVTSCTCSVQVNVGSDVDNSNTKEGGTDVETDISLATV